MKTLLSLIMALGICFSTAHAQNKARTDSILIDYYQAQKYAEAADYLKQVYPEPVTNAKVIGQLAYTSYMSGRLPDAAGYYQRLYDIDSTNVSVLFNMAALYSKRGNPQKAADYYGRIIKLDSTNFMAFKQLALIKYSKNDIVSSIQLFSKANELNPQDAETAAILSDIFITVKQPESADRILSAAQKADPENMMLMQSRIKLTHLEKKWDESIRIGVKLLAMGDNSYATLIRLGQAYYNLKNYTCCIETMATIADAQQNETSYYFIAMAYKGLKNFSLAIVYLNKAIKDGISPGIATYYGEIASDYQLEKEYPQAAAIYKKGTQFDDSSLLYYSLADMYDGSLKDTLNAIKYYKKYLSVKPPADKQKSYINYSQHRIVDLSR